MVKQKILNASKFLATGCLKMSVDVGFVYATILPFFMPGRLWCMHISSGFETVTTVSITSHDANRGTRPLH